jgi:hypothetical protein
MIYDFALTFGHRAFRSSEAFVVTPDDFGYSSQRLQDSTRLLAHQPLHPKRLD